MKRSFATLGMVLMVAVLTLTFGMTHESYGQSRKLTFGFSMPALTHSFWIPIYYGVQDEAKKLGVELVVLNAGGFDRLDNQIKQMENLIQRKVDAIIIGATSAEGIAPVVEEAVKKGIPVVGLGSQPKTDKVLVRILADDYGMGKIQAENLGKFLRGEGKVAMMSGPPGLNWTIDRAKGFRETLSKLYPSMSIVAEQWTPVSRPQALSLMEDWIQRFPDLSGIYTANDDLAVGAVEAIKAAAKTKQIKVSSANPTPLGMKYLKEGIVICFSIQQTVLQGRLGVQGAHNYLTKGKTNPVEVTPALAMTAENADTFDFSTVLHPKEFKP